MRLEKGSVFQMCFAYFTINPLDLSQLHAMQYEVKKEKEERKKKKERKKERALKIPIE